MLKFSFLGDPNLYYSGRPGPAGVGGIENKAKPQPNYVEGLAELGKKVLLDA